MVDLLKEKLMKEQRLKEPHSADLSEMPPLRIVIYTSLPPLEQLL